MSPLLNDLQNAVDDLLSQLDSGATRCEGCPHRWRPICSRAHAQASQEQAKTQLEHLIQAYGRMPVLRAAERDFNKRVIVNRLPAELLFVIFRRLDETALHSTPTRVCSHWRRAAIADTRLWTRIYVRCWHSLDAIPVLLERSGDALVDMRLELNRTPIGRPAPPNVVRCADVLADHIAHIDTLAISVFSPTAFQDIAGSALERSSSCLRKFSLRVTSRSRAVLHLNNLTSLRHLSTTIVPEAGEWMRQLETLQLDYPVAFGQLLDILAHTPALRALRLKCGVLGDPPPPDFISPAVRQLRLQEFVLEHAKAEWAALFENILPLAHVKRAAVAPVHHLYSDAPILFKAMGHISAIALNASGTRLIAGFADWHGQRRLLSISDSLDHALSFISHDGDLSTLKCVTIIATIDWQFMHWHLQNIPLDGLRTFIFELPYRLVSGVVSLESTIHLYQTLRLHTPSLENIVLTVRVHHAHGPYDPVASIDPNLALAYIERLVADPLRLPVLRLVNLRLSSGGDAAERLCRHVSRVVEEVWDPALSRRWIVPICTPFISLMMPAYPTPMYNQLKTAFATRCSTVTGVVTSED